MTAIAFVPIEEHCSERGMVQIFNATWPGSVETDMAKREVNGLGYTKVCAAINGASIADSITYCD